MNLDRVVQVLKKVNALVENLDDQGQTSAIEKDLLKRYLRDLYEHVSETDTVQKVKPADVPVSQPVQSNHVPTAPEAEVKSTQHSTVESPEKADPVFSPEKQTTYYDAESEKVPAEAEVPEPEEEEIVKREEPTKYFPPQPEQKADRSASQERTHEPDVAVSTMVDESRFAAVFKRPDATDLADKFKLQPVQSIESAMGINQRLQTINELFEGDHAAFVETLKGLHKVNNFESAKALLINGPADQFNWDQDHKVKLASDFVDLVRRKYGS